MKTFTLVSDIPVDMNVLREIYTRGHGENKVMFFDSVNVNGDNYAVRFNNMSDGTVNVAVFEHLPF